MPIRKPHRLQCIVRCTVCWMMGRGSLIYVAHYYMYWIGIGFPLHCSLLPIPFLFTRAAYACPEFTHITNIADGEKLGLTNRSAFKRCYILFVGHGCHSYIAIFALRLYLLYHPYTFYDRVCFFKGWGWETPRCTDVFNLLAVQFKWIVLI